MTPEEYWEYEILEVLLSDGCYYVLWRISEEPEMICSHHDRLFLEAVRGKYAMFSESTYTHSSYLPPGVNL